MHILNFILDLNEYLPEVIKDWCDAELEKLGYKYIKVTASEYFPDDTRAHCSVYLQLWAALHAHIAFKKKPHLSLCEKSKGAWQWNSESIVSEMNDVESADISEEREDSEATPEDFIENLEVESVKNELEDEC